jgi:RNA polymerase sigma-70 factor, ECF subfamily
VTPSFQTRLQRGLTLTGIERSLESGADFESVMREHQGMVFGLAYHFLGDPGLAEEVAQDVFLSLYRNLGAMKSAAHTVWWLRRVAVQRSIDEARKRKRRPQASLANLGDTPEPATPAASGDLGQEDFLRNATLWRMVAALPEIPRVVVILRYQEDLSPAEIAAVLDRPVATVKSDLQRALALLREKSARRFGDTYE